MAYGSPAQSMVLDVNKLLTHGVDSYWHAANSFRLEHDLKPSPRTQRSVLRLVYGDDALPKTRTEKAREKALEDSNADPLQSSVRDLEKGIARTITEMEEARQKLTKATAQHEKYTQALKAT